MDSIVENATNVSDSVRAVATAAEEQSSATEEINKTINDVNNIALETGLAMEQAHHSIKDLVGQMHLLQETINKLEKENA